MKDPKNLKYPFSKIAMAPDRRHFRGLPASRSLVRRWANTDNSKPNSPPAFTEQKLSAGSQDHSSSAEETRVTQRLRQLWFISIFHTGKYEYFLKMFPSMIHHSKQVFSEVQYVSWLHNRLHFKPIKGNAHPSDLLTNRTETKKKKAGRLFLL